MELQDGSLESLITSRVFDKPKLQQIAELVFRHGLQALDYISSKGIVHRDVKPANILYNELSGQYVFLLADFGLSNRVDVARTMTGSPVYMAPEMFQGCQQTHKVDIWAFFVTIMWTLDVGEFRQLVRKAKSYRDVEEIRKGILSGALKHGLTNIQEMAIEDPVKRASAAQMLVKCFNGEGLSTPRNKIPDLNQSALITHDAREDKVAARNALRVSSQTGDRAKNARVQKLSKQKRGPMSKYFTPMPDNFHERFGLRST